MGRRSLGNPLLLIITVVIFAVLLGRQLSPSGVAVLVGVIAVHELGHYLAMRRFGYRDLKVFFIPLVGAATMGRPQRVSAVQRVWVSFMGPLPGIVLGFGLAAFGHQTLGRLGLEIAAYACFINGLNLLPLPPLDGSRILDELVWNRHPLLTITGRVVGFLLVAAAAWALHSVFFGILAAAALLSLPQTVRRNRLAMWLRAHAAGPLDAAAGDPQAPIPPELALAAANQPEVRRGARDDLFSLDLHAAWQTAQQVPPGAAATTGFVLLHGAALVVGLLGWFLATYQMQHLR